MFIRCNRLLLCAWQARLDGIEARLDTQQNSIALLTSELLRLRVNKSK
jgi:hypothetical protein